MVIERIVERPHLLFWATMLIFFLMHLYMLTAPPNGYHQWRESDTAAVTLNYYQEDMNFFHPRINQRGNASGITGSEFPLYNYVSALLYQVTGPKHAYARLLTLLGAIAGMWLFRRIVAILSDEGTASFAVLALAFSPVYFFYSYKIMPDIWMLTFLLGAVFLFLKSKINHTYGYLAASAMCLILSASIKPLGLSVYLLFVYLIWRDRPGRRMNPGLLLVYILLTFGAVFGWFSFARYINEIHGSPGFYMGEYLPVFLDFVLKPDFFKNLFLQWPFEIWIGWVMTPLFIYGAYRITGVKSGKIYLVWVLSCYIVFFMVSSHSHTHDYYTLIIVPPLAAITGIGLNRLTRFAGWRQYALIALMLLAPFGAVARTYHRFAAVNEFERLREDSDRFIPRTALVMVQDTTPAIKLYQLNRKGWPLRKVINYSLVKMLVSQGGEYLVLDNPIESYDDSLALMFEPGHERIGNLYCYRVRNKIDRHG